MDYELMIFNRWGEMIWSTNLLEKGWNGTKNDAEILQEDVYVWKLNVRDAVTNEKRTYKGHITLLK
jgi:gliding motility-associated-like protein